MDMTPVFPRAKNPRSVPEILVTKFIVPLIAVFSTINILSACLEIFAGYATLDERRGFILLSFPVMVIALWITLHFIRKDRRYDKIKTANASATLAAYGIHMGGYQAWETLGEALDGRPQEVNVRTDGRDVFYKLVIHNFDLKVYRQDQRGLPVAVKPNPVHFRAF